MGSEVAEADDPVGLVERLFAAPLASRMFGEPVAMGDHLRQSAAMAQAARASPSLIVAALLHDIAYLLGPERVDESSIEIDHAEVAAAWLEPWFPPTVVQPVRLHVEAKRYLARTESGYGGSLSTESARTLALQGGAMTATEAERFERDPHFDSAVRLRRFDERGKDPEVVPPPIAQYRSLIESVLGDGTPTVPAGCP
jgi:[1-hydroxy-2-(trimethylamino)ethyl]phosphonate dioxygenase